MGKHRGSTKLEILGNSGNQNTRRSLHFKRLFAYRRKSGKFRELGAVRMAFTRSGVRLPLAPPASAAFGRRCWQFGLNDEEQAANFETYLKAPPGRAFTKKQL